MQIDLQAFIWKVKVNLIKIAYMRVMCRLPPKGNQRDCCGWFGPSPRILTSSLRNLSVSLRDQRRNWVKRAPMGILEVCSWRKWNLRVKLEQFREVTWIWAQRKGYEGRTLTQSWGGVNRNTVWHIKSDWNQSRKIFLFQKEINNQIIMNVHKFPGFILTSSLRYCYSKSIWRQRAPPAPHVVLQVWNTYPVMSLM